MGREIKRVPTDFAWPIDKTWWGFLLPTSLHKTSCKDCQGGGYSPEAKRLHDRWYGYTKFSPTETGSDYLQITTPEVRALAERNVASAPDYYGKGEDAIQTEAQRLANLWNGAWSHHLAQEDVDALVAAGRLMDFTHTWTKDDGWQLKDPAPDVSADEVNRWSLQGFGHDGINSGVVIQAYCERNELPHLCSNCDGHGSVEAHPGQRQAADAWERQEPPAGEGWQVWETVSEGSPITPVFATAEELVDHLVNVGAWNKTWSREAAESFVHGSGWAPTGMVISGKFHSPEDIPAEQELADDFARNEHA